MKKRFLSMALVLCMVLTLLPTSALAANTVTVTDFTSLNSALTSSASGTTVQLGGDISYPTSITTAISLTLDLNGHTLTYTGADTEKKTLMVGIRFTGTGLFSVKDSGSDGKFIASETYSALLHNAGSGTLEISDGAIIADKEMSTCVFNTGSGTVNLSGATVKSEKNYAVINQTNTGKFTMSSGTVSSVSSYAISNQGKVEISGGTVSSETSIAVYLSGSSSTLTVSGGTVKSTSYRAIENNGNGSTVTVTGGTVQTDSGFTILNFDSCSVKLSGGTVSSVSGTALANMSGGSVTISDGATVTSESGTAVITMDNLSITGGKVSSNSDIALISSAPTGSEVTVSGGTISSTNNYSAANCDGGKMTISGTAVLSAPNAMVCLLNQGAGTTVINGGTLTAKAVELYNSSMGKIEINAGTYALVKNTNSQGSIVINGGSVKTVQGTTPINSAGTPLASYGITLTDGNHNAVKDSAVTASELTFTPAVSYGFNGVKTDASGTVYLWLPSTTTNAKYKTDKIDVSGGMKGGKTCILPNFTARVTVKFDNAVTDTPQNVYLSTKDDADGSKILPSDSILADNYRSPEKGGVYLFSGLDPTKTYYVWGMVSGGTSCAKSADGTLITVKADKPIVEVNYYGLKVKAGEGIDYVFMNKSQIQGTETFVQANVKMGYIFEKWVNTADGAQGSPVKDINGNNLESSGCIMLDGKKDITAYAKLNTYDATVTLKKDDAAWASSGKALTLSPSDKASNAEGFKTATSDADGKFSFSGLSPLVTYSVWMDGTCTGQTVTPTGKDAVLDFYSVTVTKGVNIANVEGGGVYRKGTEITVTATAQAGDYVFSRWQNTTGGALVSSADHYTFTVNGAISLTAVGGATKYTATVTLKKDGADWTSSPRKIVLSTSASELAGTVTGTVSGNTYTFSNLPGTGNYFVWDAETVTYTNAQINATTRTAALDYYTVTMTPNSNITAVTGVGEYLKGSNVTVTATPADYFRITGWTDNSCTINNITKAETITATTELATYEGKVTVNKDGAAWPDSRKVISLSTSRTDGEAGKLSAFTALDPTKTYYIWAGGVYTGQTVSYTGKSAIVDYYTVSVTKTNSSVTGEGVYLAGSSVPLTATHNGFDFVGWYSGGTLLTTNTTYTIDNLSSKQELTSAASNTFSATVSLSGASGRDIKLSTSKDSLTGTVSGAGSGPYTFSGLTRGSTYYVFDSGTFTGKTVTKGAPNVTLQYYTVALTAGTGIDSVSGGGVYLEGSTATISATAASGYAFNGWSDGSAQNPYTITDLRANKSLTAKTTLAFNGTVSINNGSIVIEDDTSNPGKIRIIQGGTPLASGDNLAPNTNIIITGTGTPTPNNIIITATQDIAITLKGVTIHHSVGNNCVDISDSAGNVTINLEDSNELSARSYYAAIYKGSGSNMLTINGPGALTAFGGRSSGIGGNLAKKSTANITINGGTITARCLGSGGAGIGGGDNGSSDNIIINGGTITAMGEGGAGIGGGEEGSSGHITINGGTITASEQWGGPGIGKSTKGQSGIITITGGNIKSSMGSMPVGRNGQPLTLETCDWSDSLSFVDSLGIVYGMYGVQAIGGKMYAYVDRNTYLTANTPSSATESGITASACLSANANISVGDTVTVTVTLSGTALKPGVYTLGLTGTGISTVATQTLHVTKDQIVSTTKSFTFTMVGSNVSDLAVSLSFAEVNKHTVSFKDGETLLSSASYYEGESYTLMDGSSLQKTGYTFGGWDVTGTQTMSTSDVTHTAVWTANTYNVIFHSGGGTGAMASQSFTYGGTQALTTNSFLKDGYTFAGWRDASGTLYADKAAISVTADMTLSAVWKAETYTVGFADGGGTGTMEPQSFNHGTSQELTPNAFTRTGYAFDGWNEGSTSYVNGQSVSATKNMTLTAKWTANHYTVVYSGNGATGGTVMANQSFTYDAAQNLTTNSLTRTGYTFSGWASSATGEKVYDNGASVNNLSALQNDTVTLYAVWTPNTYTVNFNANNGSGTMNNQTQIYDVALALPENAFTRSGYGFAGWKTEANGTGISYPNKHTVKNMTTDKDGNVTLYAQWAATTYALAFNANGGVGDMDNQSFATGDSGTVSANRFTKPGYTFAGWAEAAEGAKKYSDSANLSTLENLLAANPTLFAKWTANTYTVEFNANGGTGTMSNQNFTFDESKKALTDNGFTRGSDTLLGWSTSPTAETATFANGESVNNLTTMAGGTVTLYAVWKANTYDVRFDANGGSGNMLPQTIDRSTATALTTNSFTRADFVFVGWNTKADGTGLRYVNGQEVTNLPGDTSASITLYAQWTENARFNLTGTVEDSDKAALSGVTLKLTQGSTVIAQSKSGTDGGYFFGNLKSGTYNLVAAKNGKTVTLLVTISADTLQDIIIPTAATNNSVLEVKSEPNTDAPNVTVGGLDQLASTENADITMTVTAKAEDTGNMEQLALKAKSGSQTKSVYLDMTVKKGAAILPNTANVLQVVIPFDFSGKATVKLLRYHGGVVEELEQLNEIPAAPVDGKCFLNKQAGLIHVYTSKFSTYAIAYTNHSGGGVTITSPSNVNIVNTANGKVRTDKTTPTFGTKVTITVTPDKGYQLTGLSITDSSGKQITYTNNSDGTYTFTMPNSKVTIKPTFSKMDSAFPFVDVPETNWAYDHIAWAYKGGLMNGTGDGATFEPNAATTRGMIVTVLWRMENKPMASLKASFLDVPNGAYYTQAIAWAAEHKVVEGYDSSKFGPENRITREQMAAILYRYAKYKGYDVSGGENHSTISYSDSQSVSKYAVSAIQWACGAGLINGADGKLMPQGNAERCQVAAILHRFCENVAK